MTTLVPIAFLIDVIVSFARHGGYAVATGVLIPVLTALASTAVAVVSVVIANGAKNTAVASEEARQKSERDRLALEHEGMMKESFIMIFRAVAELVTTLTTYAKTLEHQRNSNQYIPVQDRLFEPSDAVLLAEIAAARMLAANDTEVLLLNEARELVLGSRQKEPLIRAAVLAELWLIIILWQNADAVKHQELIDRFAELQRKDSLDPPSWVT